MSDTNKDVKLPHYYKDKYSNSGMEYGVVTKEYNYNLVENINEKNSAFYAVARLTRNEGEDYLMQKHKSTVSGYEDAKCRAINFIKTAPQKILADVEKAYYFKEDCGGGEVDYGFITVDYMYTIREKIKPDGVTFYMIEYGYSYHCANYFVPKYASTEKEYAEAKQRALEFIKSIK